MHTSSMLMYLQQTITDLTIVWYHILRLVVVVFHFSNVDIIYQSIFFYGIIIPTSCMCTHIHNIIPKYIRVPLLWWSMHISIWIAVDFLWISSLSISQRNNHNADSVDFSSIDDICIRNFTNSSLTCYIKIKHSSTNATEIVAHLATEYQQHVIFM